MPRLASPLLITLAFLAPITACGDSDSSPPATTGNNTASNNANNAATDPNALTFHKDVAPILEARCNGCHITGGIAPFALDNYPSVKALAPAAVVSMESGTMPPWLPDPDCRHFTNENILAPGELDTFKKWIADGMAEGDPADFHPIEAPTQPAFQPTHTAAFAEPYLPSLTISDDYRCFILDTEFEREMFLTASAVIPDAGALVHHVLVYAIEPEGIEAIQAADAAEEGPGYTCYGGPFPGGGGSDLSGALGNNGLPTQLGAWVPGSAPQILDDGVAFRVRQGSRIVMQIHYNTLSSAPTLDSSVFQMRLTEEPPALLATVKPLLIHDLKIPAGDPEAINVRQYRNHTSTTLTIASLTAHMHQLGSRFKATLQRADGGEECLMEIPRWDFNWQQTALMAPADHIQLAPGDAVTLECVYDNSPDNQAIVNGEQLTPRDVTWGDGTLDEMCMLYTMRLEPYAPTPDPATEDTCAEAGTQCLSDCAAEGGSTSACILSCDLSTSCQVCALQSIVPCAATSCLAPFRALQEEPCFETCFINSAILGSATGTCLQDACPEEFATLTTCLDPILDAGTCDDRLEQGCGFEPPAR